MILLKKAADLHNWLEIQQKKGKMIGFVPTMGALHAGHISLIEASQKSNSITVCSLFINPAQFNDPSDFDKYPTTLEKDIYQLEAIDCDVLFLPSVKEIYPDATSTKTKYDLGYLDTVLEGKYRPGHFQGVCKAVHRLLEIVKPDRLYLGQKDYQQCMVIKKLIGLIGMSGVIEVVISPTLREADGLAMSSRNLRLLKNERRKATAIFRSLNMIKQNFQKENFSALKNKAELLLAENGFTTDYIEIADAGNLQLVDNRDGKQKLVALIAASLNEVRLIDNMLLD